MLLGVVVPVFNEEATLPELLRRVLAVPMELEVVVVDDGSTDGTRAYLEGLRDDRVRVHCLARNSGKGCAVAQGLALTGGDVILVQDADLEYDPAEYPRLVEPILQGRADVVYGVRSWEDCGLWDLPRRMANRLMTAAANILYGARLSDLETCYKAFTRSAVEGLRLRSPGFGFDPEITAFFLLKGLRFAEVPVSYRPRTWSEGKKIRFRDLFVVLYTLARCRLRGSSSRPSGCGR
jgi:glycosyltransferase involved in cell wall biosynthesis